MARIQWTISLDHQGLYEVAGAALEGVECAIGSLDRSRGHTHDEGSVEAMRRDQFRYEAASMGLRAFQERLVERGLACPHPEDRREILQESDHHPRIEYCGECKGKVKVHR